jgi:hypothetical protein
VKRCSEQQEKRKVASERRIAANQQNARRSTGPKTPEGKRAVRFNGLQHGLLSREAVLPGEDEDAFEKFKTSIHAALAPVGPIETFLADRVVNGAWRLQRLTRLETSLFHWRICCLKAEILTSEVERHQRTTFTFDLPSLDMPTTEIINEASHERATKELQHCEEEQDRDEVLLGRAMDDDAGKSDAFGKLARYETTLERSFYRSLHELQRIQAGRKGLQVSTPQALDIDVSISQPK